MRFFRPFRPFLPQPVRLCSVAFGLTVALLCASGAQAGPEQRQTKADPVVDMLKARGLLPNLSADDLAQSVQSVRETVSNTASELVMSAMNFLGVPYRRGGTSAEDGFDCSGFTRHIFEMSVGLVLPRRADEQAHAASLLKIGRGELKPGDLVFFNTMKRTFSHVGIYIGDDKFVHAPKPGAEVRVDDMRETYWSHRFTGARRADLASVSLLAPATRQ